MRSLINETFSYELKEKFPIFIRDFAQFVIYSYIFHPTTSLLEVKVESTCRAKNVV